MANERKRALVTGGSSGIGFGTAQGLIGGGYRVTLIARNADRLRDAAAELGSQADWRCADVGKREQVQKALLGMERVDVLVNAAGFLRPVSLATPLEEAEANWDGVIEGNLKGSFLMAHAVAPLLASPGGRIINISSIGAQTGGSRPGAVAYAAAKSGLHGLTYALARELASRGITVNAIAPGFIADTGFTGAWPAERASSIVSETPLGRPGTPADISAAVGSPLKGDHS
jgi:NAD(P)-dependent dehydrogenase (short-subunit alcohol dehydrogenase family)